jgi:hypothetical protein
MRFDVDDVGDEFLDLLSDLSDVHGFFSSVLGWMGWDGELFAQDG